MRCAASFWCCVSVLHVTMLAGQPTAIDSMVASVHFFNSNVIFAACASHADGAQS